MSKSLLLGRTVVDRGARVFAIDTLPPDSEGYRLELGVGPEWVKAVGPLFEISLAISLDRGATFNDWARVAMHGGPVMFKGQRLDVWTMRGKWPGEHDGSANPWGRKVLRATDLRVTLNALQPVVLASVNLQPV